MRLTADSELLRVLERQDALIAAGFDPASGDNQEAMDVAMKWAALDRIEGEDPARYNELVAKYAPELPGLREARALSLHTPNSYSGSILSALCEMATLVTWDELLEKENEN